MRICPAGCERRQEDADIVVAISLDRSGSDRASLLAARLSAIVARSSEETGGTMMGDVVRALEAMERLLVSHAERRLELASFLNRFVGLRSIVARRGIFRLSVADVPVDFALARLVGYVICDLVTIVESMEMPDAPDVRIAVHPDGEQLVIAVAVDVPGEGNVLSLAGARAFKRVERLVGAIGGTLVRGVHGDDTLFGVTVPVTNE